MDEVVNVPAPLPGALSVPAVCTVITQPVLSSVAVPLLKVQVPPEAPVQTEEGTTVALVGPVRVKGRSQPASWKVKKSWNSMPPSVATTSSVSRPPPPVPVRPKVSVTVLMPLQLPTRVAPPSRSQAAVLAPPELLLELELLATEPMLATQPQAQSQRPPSQTSPLWQPAGQDAQLSGPQLALLVPPLLELPFAAQLVLAEPMEQAHCQLPLTQ